MLPARSATGLRLPTFPNFADLLISHWPPDGFARQLAAKESREDLLGSPTGSKSIAFCDGRGCWWPGGPVHSSGLWSKVISMSIDEEQRRFAEYERRLDDLQRRMAEFTALLAQLTLRAIATADIMISGALLLAWGRKVEQTYTLRLLRLACRHRLVRVIIARLS